MSFYTMIGRIALAAVCGMLIGYERKKREKPAGVKTHMIVALSAALMVIVSKEGFLDVPGADPSRVASQILVGISFLGAGVIVHQQYSIHGLTTAAGLWLTASIGMTIGAGLYALGFTISLVFLPLSRLISTIKVLQSPIRHHYVITLNDVHDPSSWENLVRSYETDSYSFSKSGKTMVLDINIVFNDEEEIRDWEKRILAQEDLVHFEKNK